MALLRTWGSATVEGKPMAEKTFTLPDTIIEIDGKGYKSGTKETTKLLETKRGTKVGGKGAVIPYDRAKALGLTAPAKKKAGSKAVKGPDEDK